MPLLVEHALVVFEHRPADGLGAFLADGFRHCFCLVHKPVGWLLCDPLKGRLRFEVLEDVPEAALIAHYAATGRTVLAGGLLAEGHRRLGPLRPLTCVELVKRMLGRSAPWVFTPHQLCRFLLTAPDQGPRFRVTAPSVRP